MNVLLIPDCWGWAYEYYARGVKSYSKHDITICPGYPKDELTLDLVNTHDVIFCFSRTIWNAFKPEIREAVGKKPNIMWCCGLSFATPPPEVDAYAVCTEKLIGECADTGIENPILLREGVDTEVFKPTEKTNSETLRVGWAGAVKRKIKRAHLLERLKYPVQIMSKHDKKYRVKGRSRKPMVDFYNGLDVFINLTSDSGSHGVSRTILESMSCGLPVIATDVSSIHKVVSSEWLVPENPEEVAVKEANKRLAVFDESRYLINEIGAINRQIILEGYSWEKRVGDWDGFFELVFNTAGKG